MAAVGVLAAAATLRLSDHVTIDWRELALLGGAGALSVGTMSAVNFALGSDFRWLLILPLTAWMFAVTLAALDARRVAPKSLTADHGR